jgi:septum formation protein
MKPMDNFEVILASASPRRKALLEQAGVSFRVQAAGIDESLSGEEQSNPDTSAAQLAEKKAGAVVQQILAQKTLGQTLIIGADTMVVLDGRIFGKPSSAEAAKEMLRALSGCTHRVITAVSVWMVSQEKDEKVSVGKKGFVEESAVTFKKLTEKEITDYLLKGESFDKAGAYSAQGEGKALIDNIVGQTSTVIGLPIQRLLAEFPFLKTQSAFE